MQLALSVLGITSGLHYATRPDVIPRICFEISAINPKAESRNYTIYPNSKIGGDPPIKVFCNINTLGKLKI